MSNSIIPYQLHEELLLDQKKIQIFTNSVDNIITLARKDQTAYECYKKLISNDYVFYYHDKAVSKFYKRKHVSELWKRKDLNQFNDLFYTLTPPVKTNPNTSSKLLVIFPCMPSNEDYFNCLIPKRMFNDFFLSIDKYLVKNVHILRIMDLNCSHGSHFCNTLNYPNMEFDVQNCITHVADNLNISKENTVLYGVAKGGTGALLNGSKLDLKVLAVDPIISLAEYNKNDLHFLKDLRIEDLSPIIQKNLNSNIEDKYVISSPNSIFNHNILKEINADSLIKIDIDDNNITKHEDVSRNCVPQQIMILNKLLSNLI
ncbi:XcbB/CpsF family capsular polysaccharide biosynthesis protein [Acinetobacter sp. 187]|uniref:XcbB/CpsF family capsular polysaccharide biosynthesis protein n=1 Tax=Acinetobacter lanii TaxID=2715163 RepID=UPI0014074262|nr:XcbB/CpsF family capsular polysaccharide biosynthesis protein [Acinetobacter lanii]NHC03359.1 XcbB/CpsF family capsular polysaccharide biosynthesis protein [Acinetobacter lanii]